MADQNNNKKKRRKRSLAKSIQRMVLVVCLLIFLLSTVLNWNIQRWEFEGVITVGTMNAAIGIGSEAARIDGLEEYARSVMETYASVPEDVRLDGGEEYYAFFKPYETSDFYQDTRDKLSKTISLYFLERAYLAMFDQETSTMVYLMDMGGDGSKKGAFRVGQWIQADADTMQRFLEQDSEKPESTVLSGKRNGKDISITTGMKLTDQAGNIYALVMVDTVNALGDAMALIFTALYFVIMLVLILVIVLIARRFVKTKLVIPIRRISTAVENYAENRKEGKTDTSSFKQLDINTRDELEELSHVMADMETDIAVYEEDLVKAGAEKERMKTELNVAAKIQLNLLPTDFSAITDEKKLDIFASMNPAREVGGDFYDFFMIDDDHLGLVMADVSGKGIPASLFMMASMIIINNLALEGYAPASVLERANERICKTNKIGMFVTVWFGILDLRTGVVTAANAGHEYPAIRHAGGDFELFKDPHGLVIGGMEGMHYREYSFTLEPGSTLFVYTDGVPEATDAKNELYGTDRMVAALNGAKDASAKELLAVVRRDVDAFVKEAPQFDDLTMMAIRYFG